MEHTPSDQRNTYDLGLVQAQAYRALNIYMAQCLRKYELTMAEWAALGRICDSGELRVSDIARELSVEVPRVIVLLKNLERRAYASRAAGASDKRVIMISPTATGRAIKDEVEQAIKNDMRLFMLGVKPKDLAAYIKVLHFLAAKLYK
ncbi:MAG: hypothetical protein NVSMB39_3150 [Candidatus Saccharimonadales bacterium]